MEEMNMSNEFQDLSTTPTLTLDPFQTREKTTPAEQQKEEPGLDESILTDEERRMVDAFAAADRSDEFYAGASVRGGHTEKDGGFF